MSKPLPIPYSSGVVLDDVAYRSIRVVNRDEEGEIYNERIFRLVPPYWYWLALTLMGIFAVLGILNTAQWIMSWFNG